MLDAVSGLVRRAVGAGWRTGECSAGIVPARGPATAGRRGPGESPADLLYDMGHSLREQARIVLGGDIEMPSDTAEFRAIRTGAAKQDPPAPGRG